MNNFTTITYQMKRDIINFSKKISKNSSKPQIKFATDMISGKNKNYEKGYHHTEIVGITKDMKQPISVFSKIHSSAEKEYKSANTITFEGIDKVCNMLDERKIKGIFVNDRGYDSNEIFRHYYKRNQYFVIRLK